MPKIDLVAGLLDANEMLAEQNRTLFKQSKVFTVNLMGVPGTGKTSILEKIISSLKDKLLIGVVEGDLYTTTDAERIEKLDVPTVQINTKGECHLDAGTVRKACLDLPLHQIDLLFIENIGNLVCPAEFDLGENARLMVISVTEGNDKPWKYPLMFRRADAIIVNKTDLINYTDFDLKQFTEDMTNINQAAKIFPASATTSSGISDIADWLYKKIKKQAK
ncbi:MAG: hydrogenase nickel incorporation protein HypB [Pelosinus sp.]|nr:hydrogenase nickel incorporation protein HypB [Pelosinus sp.]